MNEKSTSSEHGAPVRTRKSERARFMERLAVYSIGVAIGLLIVGMIWQARRAAMVRAGVDPNSRVWRQLPMGGNQTAPAPTGSADPTK